MNDRVQRGRAASTIFCHLKTHVCVVVHGDDFPFAATSELGKMRSRLCEWCDVKVRDLLGSGKRDVREIEILGRSLRWTEEGLEYEASDQHRQARLKGLGLSERRSGKMCNTPRWKSARRRRIRHKGVGTD